MNEAHCFRAVLHHFFLIIIDKHTLSHSDEQSEILKRPYTYNNIITQNEKLARTHTLAREEDARVARRCGRVFILREPCVFRFRCIFHFDRSSNTMVIYING